MTTRKEAVREAIEDAFLDRSYDVWPDMVRETEAALAASDAHLLSDATVERAARRIFADSGTGKADEWVYMPPEDERRIYFMNLARRALAAAVKEDGE